MPDNFLKKFSQTPVIGILRGTSLEDSVEIAKIYEEVGFYTLEVTVNTFGFKDILKELHKLKLCIGAGTVCNLSDLDMALESGSEFIVTPNTDVSVIEKCKKLNIPVFSGAFSPTEIYLAYTAGATAVKVFPATSLGLGYIKDLKSPFPQIPLIPTGGVNLENISDFLNAGVFGVGMGSSLFPKKLILKKDYQGIKGHLHKIKSIASDNS